MEMFREVDLTLVLDNAEKENDFGYIDGQLKNFFEELDFAPLEYYTKSLKTINSSLKEVSKAKYIIT